MNKIRKSSNTAERIAFFLKKGELYQKIAVQALERLVSEVSLENIAADDEYVRTLVRLTRDTELRWILVKDHLLMKCPVCKSKVDMNCAVSRCHVCDTEIMVKSSSLIDICEKKCPAYKNTCKGAIETEAPKVIIKRLKKSRKSKQVKQYD